MLAKPKPPGSRVPRASRTALNRHTEYEDPMSQLLGHSITYCIAVGPPADRKVSTLQTLPASDPDEDFTDTLGEVARFSLNAGASNKAREREQL